jgi:hypothetical protein
VIAICCAAAGADDAQVEDAFAPGLALSERDPVDGDDYDDADQAVDDAIDKAADDCGFKVCGCWGKPSEDEGDGEDDSEGDESVNDGCAEADPWGGKFEWATGVAGSGCDVCVGC